MNDWRVSTAFQASDTRVLVVESVQLLPTSSAGFCHAVAALQPDAVIVATRERLAVLELDGTESTLAALEARCGGVTAAVDDLLD